MSAAAADLLIRTFEEEKARALGLRGRRDAGLYYTPPQVAAQVVELALRHGGARGSVLDPCAGAGAFLLAAARAGQDRLSGFDLDAAALRVARRALRLCGARPALRQADALRTLPRAPVDLLVSNPPYGHVGDAGERAALLALFPALRGGEIDRYAAFLLRALQLVRPGGTAALLVPDTWMFLARAGPLRAAVLEQAEIAALVDLGKPFAAAKDTRVQAVVLVRRAAAGFGLRASGRSAARPGLAVSRPGAKALARREPEPYRPAAEGDGQATAVARGTEALAPVTRAELVASARRGWFVYRTQEERALCAAMEAASVPLGSVCAVGYGLRTGDNGRHVQRRAPRRSEVGLVGGEDIVPFALRWRPKTLVDAAALAALVLRQQGRPRVAIQRIRTNAQAPWARWLEAALVPPDRVCLDSLSTLACESDDLLWALLALVSSVALNRFHRLRTTDVNVKPGALKELPVPRALLASPGGLAGLAREAAQVAAGTEMSDPRDMLIAGGAREPLKKDRARAFHQNPVAHALDRRIDAAVYALFGLPGALVQACERGFWGDRFTEEIQQLDLSMSDPPANVARQEGTA